MSFLYRLKTETHDRLYYSRVLRRAAARILLMRTRHVGPESSTGEIVDAIRTLCRVARYQEGKAREEAEALLRELVALTSSRQIDWSSLVAGWKTDRIEKALVLKPCLGEREKGVLLVAFENQWARLMAISDLPDLARRYTVVLAPTWSPPHCLGTALFCAQYPGDHLFSEIANPADLPILPRISSKITAVPLYASNWVNPDLYTPVPFQQKDIDIVMVAGFGPVKRHFALFRALRELPRHIRVLLVGQPMQGRNSADLMEEARQYGVQDRFELKDSVPHDVAIQCLARAKISLMLSRQEGASVVVVESMFANTPVGIYEDAIIGSRVFINRHTGRFLRRQGLASQLKDFLAAAERYSPREWALENGIGCHESTRILNRILKESALARGEEWTQDIAVHYRRLELVLLRDEDRERLRPAYEDIRLRFGVSIGMS